MFFKNQQPISVGARWRRAVIFGMPKDISGMGLGHGVVSIVTLILVVASIAYLSRSGIDQPEAVTPARAAVPGYAVRRG